MLSRPVRDVQVFKVLKFFSPQVFKDDKIYHIFSEKFMVLRNTLLAEYCPTNLESIAWTFSQKKRGQQLLWIRQVVRLRAKVMSNLRFERFLVD